MVLSSTMSDDKLFELISKELNKGKTVALAIIIEKIGSGPRDVGAKMAVLSDALYWALLEEDLLKEELSRKLLK